MASPRPSRISGQKILDNLRLAARKGDRSALALALDDMRTLAHSPRYWEKYLGLLRNPSARLVDLLVIKQGDRIAHQKGWRVPGGGRRPPSGTSPQDRKRGQSPRSKRPSRSRLRHSPPSQPSLFEEDAAPAS